MFIFWKIKIGGVHLIEGFPNATRQRPEHNSFTKALHGRLKSQRDGTGGKLTVDPPFSFRRERGTDKI